MLVCSGIWTDSTGVELAAADVLLVEGGNMPGRTLNRNARRRADSEEFDELLDPVVLLASADCARLLRIVR